jgi:N-methylhydantoinase B
MARYAVPTMVPEGFDTTGWDGSFLPYLTGDSLEVDDSLRLHTSGHDNVDPITHEVIRYSLWNAAIEHGKTIERLAVSPITLETRDFQVTILTELGEPIFYGPFLQYFSGWTDLNIHYLLERRSSDPGIQDGDTFLCNDPWVGTGHQPDVNFMTPVFHDGQLFCWVVTSAHQNDLGGVVPGSFCQTATDIFHEPTPLPPFKIVRGGKIDVQMEELYRRHSRMPVHLSLDLRSAIAGNNHTRKIVLGLIDKYGPETVKSSMRKIIDTGEDAFVAKLRRIPDGTWRERVFMERAATGDSGTYRVELELEKRGDELIFRNSGTEEQNGCINVPFAAWRGCMVTPLGVLLLPELMGAVGGVLRRCRFEPTPGTITCPTYGAAVSPAGTYGNEMAVSMAQSVMDKMLLCSDDRELWESVVTPTHAHWMLNVISGTTQREEFFIGAMLDGVIGSTGATPFRDGMGGDGWVGCPTAQGPNVEFYEQNFPILYLYRREQTDSAGAGKWRGGSGGVIAYTPHKGNVSLATCTVYGIPKTHGILGGYPGTRNETKIARGTKVRQRFAEGTAPERIEELEGTIEPRIDKDPPTDVGPEDVVEWWWCSTGGFGDPIERDPELVGADVAAGTVSVAMAEKVYGVVFDASASVDPGGTEARRRAIRDERLASATTAPADVPEPSGTATAATQIGGSMDIRDGNVGCARCGHRFGPAAGNFKEHLAIEETTITEAGPLFVDPSLYVDDHRIRLYRFYCPSCAALFSVTVSRTDDPVLGEFELSSQAARR